MSKRETMSLNCWSIVSVCLGNCGKYMSFPIAVQRFASLFVPIFHRPAARCAVAVAYDVSARGILPCGPWGAVFPPLASHPAGVARGVHGYTSRVHKCCISCINLQNSGQTRAYMNMIMGMIMNMTMTMKGEREYIERGGLCRPPMPPRACGLVVRWCAVPHVSPVPRGSASCCRPDGGRGVA